MVSPTFLPASLKKILTKDMLEIGDISKEPNQVGTDISIPVEQAVLGMVSRLELGEQILEPRMMNTMMATSSQLEIELNPGGFRESQ